MQDEISTYRRRHPHWRMPGVVYFVTWRLRHNQSDLKLEEQKVISSALKHFDDERYELLAYVVMHNHVHVLVNPKGDYRLQDIVFSWKSFTSYILQRKFKRRNSIWQDEYFDRIVRDEEEFLEKAQYILNNPWKIWPDIQDYPWVYYKEAGTEARPTSTEANSRKPQGRP